MIPRQALEEYRNYSREEFPRLLAIVDAKNYRNVKEQSPSSKPAADAPSEHRDYKVIWDVHSQEVVDHQLNWDTTPIPTRSARPKRTCGSTRPC